MSVESVCKYNQTGFCRYRKICRNNHVDEICLEEKYCKIKGCIKRHPKLCRTFSKEEFCPYGNECAYKHKKQTKQNEFIQKGIVANDKEFNDLKDELNKLKVLISQMAIQIQILNEEIQKGKETNIAEVVSIVIKLMENSKGSELSPAASREDENHLNCDQCEFKIMNENDMIAHMAQTHGECPSCDICAKYFGTFQILKEHNEALHKELDSEPEVIEDICGAEEVQLHCKKKKKKKKSKK